MIVFNLRNLFIKMLITTQINSVEFVLIDKLFRFKLQILEFSFIVRFFIKVEYTFFIWLGTKFLDGRA